MAKKKDKEIRVKQFKQSDSDWWCGFLHFRLEDGVLKLKAGGIETEEHTKKIEAYLRRKKINFDRSNK